MAKNLIYLSFMCMNIHKTKMDKPKFYIDRNLGLNVMIVPNILESDAADELFTDLSNIEYRSDEDSMVRIMGVMHKIPRKQTAFGAKGTTYNFAGTSVEVDDWDEEYDNIHKNRSITAIKAIASDLSHRFGQTFNYALINMYPDEKSKIGYHYDDERDLVKPIIVGISLGQERQIYFKHKTGKVQKINLPHNSLMAIRYPTNSNWKHSIPSSSRKMKPRISLTFRGVA